MKELNKEAEAKTYIWVINFDDVYDFETMEHELEAFSSFQDAKNRFDDIVSDFKQTDFQDGWIEEDGVYNYEAYQDGFYSQNHYCVYLEKVELK